MADPLAWLDDEAARRQQAGLARHLVVSDHVGPGLVRRDGRLLVNAASNDYLGLAADPRVVAAARHAADRHGWGAGASPLVCGWTPEHAALAQELAAFEAAEAVALFPTGFAANQGALAALAGPGDAVFADRLDHACLIAGARASGARLRVYDHADASHLDSLLARERARYRRVLIATDAVFSMDGDLAPLADLADLADRHDAILVVDEAHGTGVFGVGGRGAAEAAGVAGRIPVRVGTLSKALGSLGGFVAGSRGLVDHLISRAPTLLFSTALPPAAAAAARAALGIVRDEPWRRDRVHRHGQRLRTALVAAGYDSGRAQGPIVPVVLGEPAAALAASEALAEAGFLVPAIRPPTVPRGTARLRISLSAVHDDAQIDALGAALASILVPRMP